MSSFVRYVLKFKDEDDHYGDVARMILRDRNVNRRWSHRQLSRYAYLQQADQGVFDVIDELARNYQLALEIREWERRERWT